MAGPDIHYFPDFEKYQARRRRRLETAPETADRTLPAGFPQEMNSSLVWEGKDFDPAQGGNTDWLYIFDEADLEEIEAALKHFLCMYTDLVQFCVSKNEMLIQVSI
jgi:hypothetical protein